MPSDIAAIVVKTTLNQITLDNAGQTVVTVDGTNVGNGVDPDFDSIVAVTGVDTGTVVVEDETIFTSDGSGKLTFSENQITGDEDFHVKIQILVFGTTDAQRGISVEVY